MWAERSAAAHVFVADLERPTLGDQDRHHLDRVLRLRPGQVVTVSDGAGAWRACAWAGSGRLDPTGEVVRPAPPAPALTVGFALTKGERPEWVVQKLTELGVDRLIPLVAARSVVRPGDEAVGRRLERWERVAREAAMQSRRTTLPRLEAPAPVPEVVAELGRGVALAEPGGDAPSLDRPAVLIGPEGGWSSDELALGVPLVDLGPGVLRAETAAVAAAVVLGALRAGLVDENPGYGGA